MYKVIIAVLFVGFLAGCTEEKKDDCESNRPVAVIKIQDVDGKPVSQ